MWSTNAQNSKCLGLILSPGTSARGATCDLGLRSRRRGPWLAENGTSTRSATWDLSWQRQMGPQFVEKGTLTRSAKGPQSSTCDLGHFPKNEFLVNNPFNTTEQYPVGKTLKELIGVTSFTVDHTMISAEHGRRSTVSSSQPPHAVLRLRWCPK